MRFEEMKSNIPETPEFIHEMIQKEVEKQVKQTKVVDIRMANKHKKLKIAFVAAACMAVTSTAIFAGSQWYHMQLEKNGTYSVSAKIEGENGSADLPKELHDIAFESAYIPEGMKWSDEYHLTYTQTPWNGGFSFASSVLDMKEVEIEKVETGVIDSEERTFGEYEGVYLQYQNGEFDKRIYLVCPDIYRVISIYIGNDVSKEDAIKVVENLSIIEEEEMFKTADAYKWSQESEFIEEGTDIEFVMAAKEEDLSIWSVGEKFDLNVTGEDENKNYVDSTISVAVDHVYVADDLEMLNASYVPEEWKEALDEDGKLKEANLSYIKEGDGVETLDEVVNVEAVAQKLVCADVTYTNETEKDLSHVLYMGTLVYLQQENGNLEIIDKDSPSDDSYDLVKSDGVHGLQSMEYMDTFEEYGNGGNYISSLKAGESVTVRMAWIVEETDLENMYLNLTGEGGCREITEQMLDTGLVDIRS